MLQQHVEKHAWCFAAALSEQCSAVLAKLLAVKHAPVGVFLHALLAGQGRWQQVKATKQPRYHAPAEAAPTGRQQRAQQRRKKHGSDDDEDLSMSDMTDSD